MKKKLIIGRRKADQSQNDSNNLNIAEQPLNMPQSVAVPNFTATDLLAEELPQPLRAVNPADVIQDPNLKTKFQSLSNRDENPGAVHSLLQNMSPKLYRNFFGDGPNTSRTHSPARTLSPANRNLESTAIGSPIRGDKGGKENQSHRPLLADSQDLEVTPIMPVASSFRQKAKVKDKPPPLPLLKHLSSDNTPTFQKTPAFLQKTRGEAADKAVVQSTDDEEEEERGPGVNDYTFEPDPEDVVMTEEEFDNPEAVSPVGNDLDKDLDVTKHRLSDNDLGFGPPPLKSKPVQAVKVVPPALPPKSKQVKDKAKAMSPSKSSTQKGSLPVNVEAAKNKKSNSKNAEQQLNNKQMTKVASNDPKSSRSTSRVAKKDPQNVIQSPNKVQTAEKTTRTNSTNAAIPDSTINQSHRSPSKGKTDMNSTRSSSKGAAKEQNNPRSLSKDAKKQNNKRSSSKVANEQKNKTNSNSSMDAGAQNNISISSKVVNRSKGKGSSKNAKDQNKTGSLTKENVARSPTKATNSHNNQSSSSKGVKESNNVRPSSKPKPKDARSNSRVSRENNNSRTASKGSKDRSQTLTQQNSSIGVAASGIVAAQPPPPLPPAFKVPSAPPAKPRQNSASRMASDVTMSVVPEGRKDQTRYLVNWIPRLKNNKLVVEGDIVDISKPVPEKYDQRWVTSRIVAVISPRIISTRSSDYVLEGPMCPSPSTENLTSPTPIFIMHKFKFGFPSNWVDLLAHWRRLDVECRENEKNSTAFWNSTINSISGMPMQGNFGNISEISGLSSANISRFLPSNFKPVGHSSMLPSVAESPFAAAGFGAANDSHEAPPRPSARPVPPISRLVEANLPTRTVPVGAQMAAPAPGSGSVTSGAVQKQDRPGRSRTVRANVNSTRSELPLDKTNQLEKTMSVQEFSILRAKTYTNVSIVNKKKSYNCDFCEFNAPTFSSLKLHVKDHHLAGHETDRPSRARSDESMLNCSQVETSPAKKPRRKSLETPSSKKHRVKSSEAKNAKRKSLLADVEDIPAPFEPVVDQQRQHDKAKEDTSSKKRERQGRSRTIRSNTNSSRSDKAQNQNILLEKTITAQDFSTMRAKTHKNMSIINNVKSYNCELCEFGAKTFASLKCHVKDNHLAGTNAVRPARARSDESMLNCSTLETSPTKKPRRESLEASAAKEKRANSSPRKNGKRKSLPSQGEPGIKQRRKDPKTVDTILLSNNEEDFPADVFDICVVSNRKTTYLCKICPGQTLFCLSKASEHAKTRRHKLLVDTAHVQPNGNQGEEEHRQTGEAGSDQNTTVTPQDTQAKDDKTSKPKGRSRKAQTTAKASGELTEEPLAAQELSVQTNEDHQKKHKAKINKGKTTAEKSLLDAKSKADGKVSRFGRKQRDNSLLRRSSWIDTTPIPAATPVNKKGKQTKSRVKGKADSQAKGTKEMKRTGRPPKSKERTAMDEKEFVEDGANAEGSIKRRGRPPKSKERPTANVTELAEEGANSEGSVKRRGRPLKSKERPAANVTELVEEGANTEGSVKRKGRPPKSKERPAAEVKERIEGSHAKGTVEGEKVADAKTKVSRFGRERKDNSLLRQSIWVDLTPSPAATPVAKVQKPPRRKVGKSKKSPGISKSTKATSKPKRRMVKNLLKQKKSDEAGEPQQSKKSSAFNLVMNPQTVKDRVKNANIFEGLNKGHEDNMFESEGAKDGLNLLPNQECSDGSGSEISVYSARTPIEKYMKRCTMKGDDPNTPASENSPASPAKSKFQTQAYIHMKHAERKAMDRELKRKKLSSALQANIISKKRKQEKIDASCRVINTLQSQTSSQALENDGNESDEEYWFPEEDERCDFSDVTAQGGLIYGLKAANLI